MSRTITRADIMPMEEYGRIRRQKAREISEHKRHRRVAVGPHATFYFESYQTMWRQVHEMLFVEGGGEEQIEDELSAYNPLIPDGRELVATVMFEIDNPVQRHAVLARLGGVEETFFMRVGSDTIDGVSERDVDRTTADGKASSVQFVHFPFTPEQIERFRDPDTEVVVGMRHPEYAHMAVIGGATRKALAEDFASA
jgi:hypothetical protein